MENVALEVLNFVQLNGIIEFRNMAVVPFAYDGKNTAEYLTLKIRILG